MCIRDRAGAFTHAPMALERAQYESGHAFSQGPDAWAPRGLGEAAEPRGPRGAAGSGPDRVLAQLQKIVGERDAGRTDLGARPAEAGRERELGMPLEPVEERAEDRADGAGIGGVVGVATDLAVHGAHVEARPASDAVEDLLVLGAEDGRAAVVDEDHVQFLGAVAVAGPR